MFVSIYVCLLTSEKKKITFYARNTENNRDPFIWLDFISFTATELLKKAVYFYTAISKIPIRCFIDFLNLKG